MKKYIKHFRAVAALLALLLTVSLFAACNTDPLGSDASSESESESEAPELPAGAVTVNRPGKTEVLLPGDYPTSDYGDPDALKWGQNVYVSNVDGLTVTGQVYTDLHAMNHYTHTLYMAGDLHGSIDGVFRDGERILDAPCTGIFYAPYQGSPEPRYDPRYLVFTTAGEESDPVTEVHEVTFSEDGTASVTRAPISLDGEIRFIFFLRPSGAYDVPETIYVITSTDFCLLSLSDWFGTKGSTEESFRVESVEVPSYWKYLEPTSAVKIGGTVWFGDRFGIVSYETETRAFTYYPVTMRSTDGH